MIVVDVATAVICFAAACYPALVGVDTPTGVFDLEHRSIPDVRYGGDVLLFAENETTAFLIHRVINVPHQNRIHRLLSDNPSDRTPITAGCINVLPSTYDALVKCCSTQRVLIK